MSVQNKPDYKIFADGAKPGEVVTFPDVLRGWGVTLDTTGGIPPMEFFNSFGKRLNEWLMYLTQRGIPEWDASVEYPKGAVCYDGDVFYVSLKAVSGDKPSTSQLSWSSFGSFFKIDDKVDKSQITNGLVNDRNKVTSSALVLAELNKKQPAGDYQPKGEYALLSDLKSLIKPGFTMQTILDEADIAPPWYLINGDRYGLDTPQGKVLRAFSADLKARWNITQTAETITLPKTLQSDGRMPFLRPVNGTARKTGTVTGDTMRNFTGELGYSVDYGLSATKDDLKGVFSAVGTYKKALSGGGSGSTYNIRFDPSSVVPTGPENKPLDVGVTWIMYLGV